MWWYIPMGIIILAGTIIIVIVVRRLPQLATLRTDILEREKTTKVKFQIIERRLLRKVREIAGRIMNRIKPLGTTVHGWLKRVHEKALEMEQRYKVETRAEKEEKKEESSEGQVELEQKLKKVLIEGDRAREAGDTPLAEKKYIEALSLDTQCVEAYQGLGKVYVAREEWMPAKETYGFLVKLVPADATVHAAYAETLVQSGEWEAGAVSYQIACELEPNSAHYLFEWGQCLKEIGDRTGAAAAYAKAVEREPGNPKYLDFLIEASILCGNKLQAQNAFDMLKRVNPENQKLDEFEQRIRQMGKRWEPARKLESNDVQSDNEKGSNLKEKYRQ